MDSNPLSDLLLAPCRVLDLTDEKGFLCGKLLGDFGADVIKIEPPGGDPSRNLGPFYKDAPDAEKSLYWFAYNCNKRGITLNLETEEGQKIFKNLAEKADVVLESFSPGYLASLGLNYTALSTGNPRLIVSSITPFGQDGPYWDYKASDLVLMAMSGVQYLYGDPDRPPVRISFPQAYLHASCEAFVGTLTALYYRELTCLGQQVDVSAQESAMWAMFNALPTWDMNKTNLKRNGPFRGGLSKPGVVLSHTWRCKDGFVGFMVQGGKSGEKTNKALVDWMNREGMANDFLNQVDWSNYDFSTTTQEFHNQIQEPIATFFLAHTQKELFAESIRRGIMLYPANTTKDICEDPQLNARGFWQHVEHPELQGQLTYPGAFLKASTANLNIRRRAPLIGEHNLEIYNEEIGLSREEMVTLKQAGII